MLFSEDTKLFTETLNSDIYSTCVLCRRLARRTKILTQISGKARLAAARRDL